MSDLLTRALMMIGTVIGKMKRGTVSWLKSASAEKTLEGDNFDPSR